MYKNWHRCRADLLTHGFTDIIILSRVAVKKSLVCWNCWLFSERMATKLCFIRKYWKNCGESWSELFVKAHKTEDTIYDETHFLKLLIALVYTIYTLQYRLQRHISKLHSVFGAVLETMHAEALVLLEVGRCSSFSWRSTQQATFMILFTSLGFTEIFIQPAFDLPALSSPTLTHMQLQRHWPFKMHKIEIWQSFTSHIFGIPPSNPSFYSFLPPPVPQFPVSPHFQI